MTGVRKVVLRKVPMVEWGRDHWSLFGYLETVCVDYQGAIDPSRLRCNPFRHPGLARNQHRQEPGAYRYPTRLRDSKTEPEHDDHDCFDDIEAEGLVKNVGTGINPVARMTEKGLSLAARLREHKAKGGAFSTFQPMDLP